MGRNSAAAAFGGAANRHAMRMSSFSIETAPMPDPFEVLDPAWGPSQEKAKKKGHGPSHLPFKERFPNVTLPIGAHNVREYDEKHGRWWVERKEEWRPKLFSPIGRHARDPKLHKNMLRWVINTPAWKKLAREMYRKRWPALENLCMRFFAEFGLKNFRKRTLLETAHTLPLYGRGCKFWRGNRPDAEETKGQFFVAESVEFKLRPIRGEIRGTQHVIGRPVISGISPIAKTLGSWRYEFPKGAHPAVYRPPFPPLKAGSESPSA